jgi:hypothetical protein
MYLDFILAFSIWAAMFFVMPLIMATRSLKNLRKWLADPECCNPKQTEKDIKQMKKIRWSFIVFGLAGMIASFWLLP